MIAKILTFLALVTFALANDPSLPATTAATTSSSSSISSSAEIDSDEDFWGIPDKIEEKETTVTTVTSEATPTTPYRPETHIQKIPRKKTTVEQEEVAERTRREIRVKRRDQKLKTKKPGRKEQQIAIPEDGTVPEFHKPTQATKPKRTRKPRPNKGNKGANKDVADALPGDETVRSTKKPKKNRKDRPQKAEREQRRRNKEKKNRRQKGNNSSTTEIPPPALPPVAQ